MTIAIVGAGLIGRILALECRLAGMDVSLFDRDGLDGQQSCAYAGAGMLAPYAELEQTEPIIAALGIESLFLWPQLLKKLPRPVFFQNKGTLVLAHPQDYAELSRFERSLKFKLGSSDWQQFESTMDRWNCRGEIYPPASVVSAGRLHRPLLQAGNVENRKTEDVENRRGGCNPPVYSNCDRIQLLDLESDLPTIFSEGLYLPEEGQIDNRQLLDALKVALQDGGVNWQTGVEIVLSDLYDHHEFNFIIDCRGLGSQPDLKQLRGVRGELIVVEAKGVKLNRPIRLMHPRHPIYIVPRENNRYLIGATSIESADMRLLTVQSALELLSAACTIHPGFAEGTIIESRVNCRPALPNNLPAIILSGKDAPMSGKDQPNRLIHVNGLYRHGFLVSPKLAKLVLAYIINGKIDQNYKQLFVTDRLIADRSNTNRLSTNKLNVDHQLDNGETALAISH